MPRALLGFLFAALICAADKPAFDVADVYVSPRADWVKTLNKAMQGGYLAADRYQLRRATMLDLITIAYSVDPGRVYGGPAWLDYDRYEVVAKTRPGTRQETLRLMLQSLLEDRFHLAVKAETRDVPAYILSKGKGELKLKAAAEGQPPGGCSISVRIGGDTNSQSLHCRNASLAAFAQQLRGLVASPMNPTPVVDSTNLDGRWDIDLDLPNAAPGTANPAGLVFDQVAALGLKFALAKAPQPVLVVENVSEQPSPNPPAVAEALPPLPPADFEVAEIKWPCESDARGSRALHFETGGRVLATCVGLVSLIEQAWGMALNEKPFGIPKWLEDDHGTKHNISIAAKAPEGVAPDPQHNAQARDVLNQMLQRLLLDRYQMKVHYEDRPMDAHTLVAVKPKLAKADPANRTGCVRESQQQQGRSLLVQFVCRNITMTQFAEQIRGYSPEIIYPVLDGTGLSGTWDFALNYDAFADLNARFPQFARPAAGPDGQAPEPSGALSFVDALQKQLGLKLEVQKRPVPVLVIDHIEEKPLER